MWSRHQINSKFRRTARRTVIKISGLRNTCSIPGYLRPIDRETDRPRLTCLYIQLHTTSNSVYPTSLSWKVHSSRPLMTLFRWLMLIAAISLAESSIIFKETNQQISNVPQKTTVYTTNENQGETSLHLPRRKRQTVESLKRFINITQAIPLKTVFIPVRMHQFTKIIPFQQVYSQITNLKITLEI